MDKNKEYVVLETLVMPDRGKRFFSVNCHWEGSSPHNTNNTHSYKGELWYKEIAFCDTAEEAQSYLHSPDQDYPSMQEVEEHVKKEFEDRANKEAAEEFDIFKKLLDK